MKNIISMLAEHDWDYIMSDDPNNFRRGLENERKIRNELMKYELNSIISNLEFIKERVTKMYHQK